MYKFLIRTTQTAYCLLSASNYSEAYTQAKANVQSNEGICYIQGFSESEIENIREIVKLESLEVQAQKDIYYFRNNKYLRCAVNPVGTCYDCQHFEPANEH